MKTCPFCAEDIKDAAVVCKHCGRDLQKPPPTTPAAPVETVTKPRFGWGSVKIVAIVIGGFAALVISVLVLLRPSESRVSGGKGDCVLRARAAVVSRNTPIGRATNWNTDVLAIRSADSDDWIDLEVTIFGFETTGTKGKQPTGPYRKMKDRVSAGALASFQLNDFENTGGEHWVSLTMNADTVGLKASIRGEACAAEISVNGSQP